MIKEKLIKKIYKKTKSYAMTARLLGISRQRVHQVIKKYNNHGREHRIKKYKKLLPFSRKCEICKKEIAIILHHKDFNNKNDNLNNLQPVCKSCHIILHNIFRNGPGNYKFKNCEECKKEFNINLKHEAKGLCPKCYGKYARKKFKQRIKKYHKKYYKKNRQKLRKKAREYYYRKRHTNSILTY